MKHILGSNVAELRTAYGATSASSESVVISELEAIALQGGLDEFGNLEGDGVSTMSFPVHQAWLEPFAVANRLISNGEYLEFMADGGYQEPLLWLANGWARVQEKGWEHPLYWGEGERRVAAVEHGGDGSTAARRGSVSHQFL